MIVLDKSPEVNVGTPNAAKLSVDRTDISFEDVAEERVCIRVTVHNVGDECSSSTIVRLECAPLGAFVPWQPLSTLPVPRLEPGEGIELSTEVVRPRPTPLGSFDRVPPQRLLTAISSPDQNPRPSAAGFLAVLDLLKRGRGATPTKSWAGRTGGLPADLMELVGQDHPHWAGNLNVFIGTRPVERHMARALRVHAGRTNLAMFLVGNPTTLDAYRFELLGLSADWKAALFDVSNARSLVVDPSHPPIQESEWLESKGGMVVLMTRPPAGCQVGNLEVHVTRRSTGETATVEFSLDPTAQGAGCFSM